MRFIIFLNQKIYVGAKASNQTDTKQHKELNKTKKKLDYFTNVLSFILKHL